MTPWASDLAARLGREIVTDADALTSVARDQAPLAPAGTAAALVRARSVLEVQTTLAFAHERGIPVVTRGAGTGLAGGANALDGCIVLSVAAMDRIVALDPQTRTAVVEPGVITARLAEAAAAHGLYYAPDPSSREISTIGGNIATNAGGACCLKYGVTGDHVAALAVVLADGTAIRTGAITRKNVTGLDLTRILVGSEGTLGVIVEATVRLLRPPSAPATLLASFGTLADAAQAIVAMEDVADLSLVEIMDRTTITAVETMTRMGLDTTAEALVLVQSDVAAAMSAIEACARACERAHAREVVSTGDAREGAQLLGARRLALPALERMGPTLLDDIAVPKPALAAMLERIRCIADACGVVIGTFGHAGDGNLHPTIVLERGSPDIEARASRAFAEVMRAALELGGTLTGEHGIGSLKPAFVPLMLGSVERALMSRIKRAFDPTGILNPGKGW